MYPEPLLRQGVLYSLQDQAANSMCYLGPEATLKDIIQKLDTQYGQAASTDVLFQKFYELSQEKSERVHTFTARPEGCLNQLWLCFPKYDSRSRCEQATKGTFILCILKPLRGSVCYLYNNQTITYTRLMVATRKAEGKWWKVNQQFKSEQR